MEPYVSNAVGSEGEDTEGGVVREGACKGRGPGVP